jgi:ubiquinone/menaquinone biosynthesis C-methylase UbiE
MAPAPSKNPADHPLDPIEYYDKAAPTYEVNSTNLKDIARHFLTLGTTPQSPDSVVLDNACGPGAVTGEIFARVPLDSQPKAIYATDGLDQDDPGAEPEESHSHPVGTS